MHKIVVLYNTPVDPEHFRSYYVTSHLPLAAQLPGLLASRYSFAVNGPPGPAPFFCVWEGEFADQGARARRDGLRCWPARRRGYRQLRKRRPHAAALHSHRRSGQVSSAPVVDWVSAAGRMKFPQGMLVDGRFVGADSNELFTVIGPRDGRAITSLPEAGSVELDQAVAAARRAFDAGVWRNRRPAERRAILVKLSELLDRDRANLALLDSLSMGAPITMTHDHCVQWAIDSFRWYGEAIDKVYDEIAPRDRAWSQ